MIVNNNNGVISIEEIGVSPFSNYVVCLNSYMALPTERKSG